MKKSTVYFSPLTEQNKDKIAVIAELLFRRLTQDSKIALEKKLPVKIHSGQPGNITFIKPPAYTNIIKYLLKNGIQPYFTETCMVTGPRSKAATHLLVARDHGFTQIPLVIADGENGDDHLIINVTNGIHFKQAKIARILAESKQVLVMSHFKGHIDAGFGAALKMLGIGFASRIGKIEQHSNNIAYHKRLGTIDWSENDKLYHGKIFSERIAEYAQAAIKDKQNIYLNFALNLVTDCDCDGVPLKPIYKDLGIFASLDPVAVDKACFDLLSRREHKKPFEDNDIFDYAVKLGLGNINYDLITLTNQSL